MGCYLGVIGNIQNYECLIYIFTVKVPNGTPSIFNKSLYHFWYKELRNHFSPLMINTTPKYVDFLNQNNREITKSGVIDQQTINPQYLCYQCSKDGQYFLF